MTATYEVCWGDALVVHVFRFEGGLKRAVDTIRDLLGPTIGTRNTFGKLLKIQDPVELTEIDRFRAWLLLTVLGMEASDFGIDDEAVPRHYDVERLRADLYTPRDSNPEPAD